MTQATEIKRTKVLHALYDVLDTGNALSRCHAIRAIERLKPREAKAGSRLIDLLSDPDPDVRTDAAAALGNMEIGEATAALLGTMQKDHEGDVRIQAVIALSKIKSQDAVEPLIDCFTADGYPELDYMGDDMEYSPCWEVQSQAMEALGQIRDHRATQPLIDVLASEQYDDLQESGFKVLAQLDADKSRDFLVQQLTHDNPRTRRRAAQGLGSLLDLRDADRSPPREILDGLVDALLDFEPAVRTSAVRALAGIDDPEVVSALGMLIGDPDVEVRAAVAAILGNTKGTEILEALHELLEEADLKLKRSVVSILGQIGDGRSQEPLISLLETEDEDLLHKVLQSLGQIGTSGSEQRLAEILSAQDKHAGVRSQAAVALGNILGKTAPTVAREDDSATPSPKQVLASTVFDADEQLACASLSALVTAYPDEAAAWLSDIVLGRPLILLREEQSTPGFETQSDAQQKDAEDEQSECAVIACGDPETSTLASIVVGLPGDRPVPECNEDAQTIASTSDKSARQQIRIFAARLLGGVAAPGTTGVDALMEAFRTSDKALRRETLLALGHIGDKAALPVVFEALDSTHPDVRLAALELLQDFQMPAGAQERVDALCADPDPNLRCAAISALGSGSVAKGCLYRALGDEDQRVCQIALHNLSKETYGDNCDTRVLDLIFRFSGELRREAGAALRRAGDLKGVTHLIDVLREPEQEELHWLCIDALAEFFSGTVPATEV